MVKLIVITCTQIDKVRLVVCGDVVGLRVEDVQPRCAIHRVIRRTQIHNFRLILWDLGNCQLKLQSTICVGITWRKTRNNVVVGPDPDVIATFKCTTSSDTRVLGSGTEQAIDELVVLLITLLQSGICDYKWIISFKLEVSTCETGPAAPERVARDDKFVVKLEEWYKQHRKFHP